MTETISGNFISPTMQAIMLTILASITQKLFTWFTKN